MTKTNVGGLTVGMLVQSKATGDRGTIEAIELDAYVEPMLLMRHKDNPEFGVALFKVSEIEPVWTIASIAARRATGDALVTVNGWACSFTTGVGPTVHSAQLSLRRYAPGSYSMVVEVDACDGDIFDSSDLAECYALNTGRLQWYRDTESYRNSERDRREAAARQKGG